MFEHYSRVLLESALISLVAIGGMELISCSYFGQEFNPVSMLAVRALILGRSLSSGLLIVLLLEDQKFIPCSCSMFVVQFCFAVVGPGYFLSCVALNRLLP